METQRSLQVPGDEEEEMATLTGFENAGAFRMFS